MVRGRHMTWGDREGERIRERKTNRERWGRGGDSEREGKQREN